MDTLLKCPRVRCQPAASRAEVPLLKKAHREVFIRRTLDGVRLTDKVIPTGGISETAANADKCKAVRLTAGCGYSQTNRYYDFTRQEMACLLSARPAGFIDACSSVFVDQTRAGCIESRFLLSASRCPLFQWPLLRTDPSPASARGPCYAV